MATATIAEAAQRVARMMRRSMGRAQVPSAQAQSEGVPFVGIERPELRDEHACHAKADQHQWKDAARGHGQRAEDTKAGHAPSLGGFVASFLRLRLRQFCQMLFHRIFLEQMFPPF